MIEKKPTSFRLTLDALALLQACSRQRGIQQTDVVEQAIRDYAKAHGIRVDATPPTVAPEP